MESDLQTAWPQELPFAMAGTQGNNSYDGRGFLARLSNNGGADAVTNTYGSEGQLYHRHDLRGGGAFTSDAWFFDFGGRPLASLEKLINNGSPQTLLRFYTTDHLNTPVLATDATGAVTWIGGFDPFGDDSFSSAQKLRSYHRFPGQWQDNQWYGFSKFADFSYNLHRWYDSATGRYTAPDPVASASTKWDSHPYVYARSAPTRRIDPLGLTSWSCISIETSASILDSPFAGAVWYAECESECVDGRKAIGQYLIGGVGFGFGVSPAEVSAWSLEDGVRYPDPANLEGPFSYRGCSVTPCSSPDFVDSFVILPVSPVREARIPRG